MSAWKRLIALGLIVFSAALSLGGDCTIDVFADGGGFFVDVDDDDDFDWDDLFD